MAEIAGAEFQAALFIGEAPADGVVGVIADDGSVQVLDAWDPATGDVLHTAPAGTAGGGGTRRHLFDAEVYANSGTRAVPVYVNVRAWASITGRPTTVAGYGITDAITTAGGQTIAGTLNTSGAVTINTNATYFTGKTAGAVAKRLIGVNAGGLVSIDADAVGTTHGAGIVVAGAITTGTDAANDLGSGSFRFRAGFFSGTVTVATLTATNVGGTLSTAAQPNITSVGTLTSLTVGGTITSGMSGQLFSRSGASTAGQYFDIINTSGWLRFGIEGSVVGILAGATAYSTVFATNTNTPMYFGPNGVVALTLAGSGAATFATTVATSGTITTTRSTAGDGYLLTTGAVDVRATITIQTHGGAGYGVFGVEGSVGGGILTGSASHATVFAQGGSTPIQFGVSNAVVFMLASGGVATHYGATSPGTDNAFDLGGASFRWRTGYFATSAIVGTDPTGTGTIRTSSARIGGIVRNMIIEDNGADITFNFAGVGDVALWSTSRVVLNYNTVVNGTLFTISNTQTSGSTAGDIVIPGANSIRFGHPTTGTNGTYNFAGVVASIITYGDASWNVAINTAQTLTIAGQILATGFASSIHSISTTYNANYAVNLENKSATSGHVVELNSSTAAGTGWAFIDAFANAVVVFSVRGNGNVQNTNNSYGAISDEREKRDVVPASSQWADILALKVKKFRLLSEPDGPLQLGVIAQDVLETSPGLVDVTELRDDARELTGETRLSVKYSVLYMKAVGALQEAMRRVESLEAWAGGMGYTVPAFA